MALRIEAFLAFSLTLAAQPFEFAAKHDRLFRDKPAMVRVDDQGITAGTLKWAWDDIQQLTLTERDLRLLTYADSRWRVGRDRETLFEDMPKGTAESLYPILVERLDQRLIAAVPLPASDTAWEIPVKLLGRLGGSEGTLVVGRNRLVYRTAERGQSRTWRVSKDIENVSSAGPFDFVLTTSERRGLLHGGPSEFRFQLKRALAPDRYEALWRSVQKSKGLDILQSYKGEIIR